MTIEENPLYNIITDSERKNFSNLTVNIKASNKDIFFTISENVKDKVCKFSWNVSEQRPGYYTIKTCKMFSGIKYSIKLTHFLMGKIPVEYDVVDHCDRNTLNNTYLNLRFATFSTNSANVPIRGSVPFYGVRLTKYKKYTTFVRGKYEGTFDIKEHAAWLYNLIVLENRLDLPINNMTEPINFIRKEVKRETRKRKTILKENKGTAVCKIDGNICLIVNNNYIIIDKEYEKELSSLTWRINYLYPQTNLPGGTQVMMHRYIMLNILKKSIKKDCIIDHINRNKFDNRVSNLRIVSKSANSQNTSSEVGKSGFIGVSNHRSNYEAHISVYGKRYNLGTFYSVEIAAYAYDCAAIYFHGEHSKINNVEVPLNYTWNIETLKLEQTGAMYLDKYNRNKNGFKGVDFLKGQYRANLKKTDGTSIWLGTFDDVMVAAYAHNCMALKLFGEKAILNNVPEPKGYIWDDEKNKLYTTTKKQYKKKQGIEYRGVSIMRNGFGAAIYKNKKRIHLGIFKNKEVAAYAFNCAILTMIGEKAELNDVPVPDGYTWDPNTMKLKKIDNA